MNLEEFKITRKQLHATEEDFELALENIDNLKLSQNVKVLFCKDLSFNRRYKFRERFELTLEEREMSTGEMFETIKSTGTDTEKSMFTYLVEDDIQKGFFNGDFNFLNKLKLDLKW